MNCHCTVKSLVDDAVEKMGVSAAAAAAVAAAAVESPVKSPLRPQLSCINVDGS